VKHYIAFVGLACAFIAASVRAAEETGVSLYGLVDAGVGVTHHSSEGSHTGGLSSGQTDSFWGLRGIEHFDQGWRANFQLESGFDATNGMRPNDTRLFNYGAWLGVAHDDVGELRLGRQRTVGQQFGSALEIASWKEMGMGATFRASDNYQFDDVVNYLTPEVAGFQMGLGYSFSAGGEQGYATTDNNREFSAGLKYQQGPWLAALTWDQMWLARPELTQGRKPQALQIGASYDFSAFKVSLAWSRQRNGYVGMNGGDPDHLQADFGPAAFLLGGSVEAWLVGASVPCGPGHVLLQWSLANPNWKWDNGERARQAQVATLGYVYDLSSRTSLYGFVGYMENYTIDNQFDPDHTNTSRVGLGVTQRF